MLFCEEEGLEVEEAVGAVEHELGFASCAALAELGEELLWFDSIALPMKPPASPAMTAMRIDARRRKGQRVHRDRL